MSGGLDAVFEPKRIALVGASDEPGKMGELLWRNLATFPGEVVPVSPSAVTVGGVKAYPTLTAIEGPVDLAVLVVPAAAAPGVLRDAGEKGVRAAVVITAGFAEVGGDGIRLQDELIAAARAGGVRIVGPNVSGIQNCDLPLNASIAGGTPAGGGGISLATQSGAYGMAMHALGIDERVHFAKVYAAGNKADIGDAEMLRYLGADPATHTVCVFLESLEDGRAFFEAAREITPTKPIVVAKTGRSAAGARAALSHTAALAGEEHIWRAAFDQAGVVLARTGLEMMDTARALETQPVPAGRRIGVVTNSGGTGVELADLLADEGLEVPELSPSLQDELRVLLPPVGSPRNPVDMTPIFVRYPVLYPGLVDRVARSGEVDAVVTVILQRATTDERVATGVRDTVARLRADGVDVPVYVCWVAPRSSRPNADLLQEGGVPCFDWPERTARAVGHAVRYGEARERLRAAPVTPTLTPAALALDPGTADGLLEPDAAARLLADAGVPTAPFALCDTADEAVAAADRLGHPAVLKAVHPSLVHKTDVGGVRLGLADAAAVRTAAGELLSLVDGARVLVQPQLTGVEVVVGGDRNPQFGPVVMVGLGGVFVEVLGDVAFGLAPLDRIEARRLIDGLRGRALLAGARGARPVDLDALADLVSAVGDLLAAVPEVAELDLNPVLATAEGCVAVDWRVVVRHPNVDG